LRRCLNGSAIGIPVIGIGVIGIGGASKTGTSGFIESEPSFNHASTGFNGNHGQNR